MKVIVEYLKISFLFREFIWKPSFNTGYTFYVWNRFNSNAGMQHLSWLHVLVVGVSRNERNLRGLARATRFNSWIGFRLVELIGYFQAVRRPIHPDPFVIPSAGEKTNNSRSVSGVRWRMHATPLPCLEKKTKNEILLNNHLIFSRHFPIFRHVQMACTPAGAFSRSFSTEPTQIQRLKSADHRQKE